MTNNSKHFWNGFTVGFALALVAFLMIHFVIK